MRESEDDTLTLDQLLLLNNADQVLFGHPRDSNIKISQKVEIVSNIIVIIEDRLSTHRLQEAMESLAEPSSDVPGSNDGYDEEDGSWETEEEAEFYKGEGPALNDFGVLQMGSEKFISDQS